MPIIFFAMHLKKLRKYFNLRIIFSIRIRNISLKNALFLADGSNDTYIELWNEVWNDVIGSMEVTLMKYKTPVIKFLNESFSSPAWSTKTQVRTILKAKDKDANITYSG